MYAFIVIVIIIACCLLGLIVLVQNSKGGGLVAGMQSSNQFMGVRQTADFLEKTTWTLAIVILLLSLISLASINRGEQQSNETRMQKYYQENGVPVNAPAQNAEQPAGN